MPKRFVRMRVPGEAPGLTQRRHAIRNPFGADGKSWVFDAGMWVILELSQPEEQFLTEYCNQAGVRLIDVADSKASAAKIVIDRKRQMAAARARAFPAATIGEEGKVGTDDDLLNVVTAEAAEKSVEEAIVELDEPEASLVKRAEYVISDEENGSIAEPLEPEEEDTAINDTIGVLVTVMSHEAAQEAADRWGSRLSWIVANDPDKFTEIHGVGKKTVENLKKIIGA